MDYLSDSIIFIIGRHLISYDDLISLYMVSKTMSEGCNFILNEFRNDSKLIKEMIIKSREKSDWYQHIFFDRHVFNGWYKFGYYLFTSTNKIKKQFIPKGYIVKNHKSNINEGYYTIIVKKKKEKRKIGITKKIELI